MATELYSKKSERIACFEDYYFDSDDSSVNTPLPVASHQHGAAAQDRDPSRHQVHPGPVQPQRHQRHEQEQELGDQLQRRPRVRGDHPDEPGGARDRRQQPAHDPHHSEGEVQQVGGGCCKYKSET